MTTRPARKKVAAQRAAAPAPPTPQERGTGLLKALGDEVAAQHTRFFESLLGIDAQAARRKAGDLFRLPSFEDLFDERVARSLERLGATEALAGLRAQLATIDQRLRRVERALEPASKPRKPRAGR
jgi:hypothetical protein